MLDFGIQLFHFALKNFLTVLSSSAKFQANWFLNETFLLGDSLNQKCIIKITLILPLKIVPM